MSPHIVHALSDLLGQALQTPEALNNLKKLPKGQLRPVHLIFGVLLHGQLSAL